MGDWPDLPPHGPGLTSPPPPRGRTRTRGITDQLLLYPNRTDLTAWYVELFKAVDGHYRRDLCGHLKRDPQGPQLPGLLRAIVIAPARATPPGTRDQRSVMGRKAEVLWGELERASFSLYLWKIGNGRSSARVRILFGAR